MKWVIMKPLVQVKLDLHIWPSFYLFSSTAAKTLLPYKYHMISQLTLLHRCNCVEDGISYACCYVESRGLEAFLYIGWILFVCLGRIIFCFVIKGSFRIMVTVFILWFFSKITSYIYLFQSERERGRKQGGGGGGIIYL